VEKKITDQLTLINSFRYLAHLPLVEVNTGGVECILGWALAKGLSFVSLKSLLNVDANYRRRNRKLTTRIVKLIIIVIRANKGQSLRAYSYADTSSMFPLSKLKV
jgi:hypothetical protein